MHVNSFVITIYNIFLSDLFINFVRYYYNAAKQWLYSKMAGFSADLCSTNKTKSIDVF